MSSGWGNMSPFGAERKRLARRERDLRQDLQAARLAAHTLAAELDSARSRADGYRAEADLLREDRDAAERFLILIITECAGGQVTLSRAGVERFDFNKVLIRTLNPITGAITWTVK